MTHPIDPITDRHDRLAADLTRRLELDAGLREVHIGAARDVLSRDLAGALDLDAGLSAVAPSAAGTDDHTPVMAVSHASVSATADELRKLPVEERFGMRRHASTSGLAIVCHLDVALWDIALESMRYPVDSESLLDARTALHQVVELSSHVGPELRDECGIARYMLRRAQAFSEGHVKELVDPSRYKAELFDLLSDQLVMISKQSANAAIRAAETREQRAAIVHDLAALIGPRLERDRELLAVLQSPRHKVHAVLASKILKALTHQLNDFTGADLRHADVATADLTGVRWSTTTRWPDGWHEQVLLASDEVEPGVFVIRGGSATVRSDA